MFGGKALLERSSDVSEDAIRFSFVACIGSGGEKCGLEAWRNWDALGVLQRLGAIAQLGEGSDDGVSAVGRRGLSYFLKEIPHDPEFLEAVFDQLIAAHMLEFGQGGLERVA